MTIDILPTVAKLIGAELPKQKIDGLDCGALLRGESNAKSPHESFNFYYQDNQLQAVRSGKWKLVLPHTYRTMKGQADGKDGIPGKYKQVKIESPELYDLAADVGETTNIAAKFPNELKRLLGLAETARDDLGDSLTKREGKNRRAAGKVLEGMPEVESSLVFPLHPKHNHAPGIVECPNGDILVSWYRGSGERTADDGRIRSEIEKGFEKLERAVRHGGHARIPRLQYDDVHEPERDPLSLLAGHHCQQLGIVPDNRSHEYGLFGRRIAEVDFE